MSDMTNVEKMLNRQFKGEYVRELLGAQLCDTIRVYDGMSLNAQTLGILIEQAGKSDDLDFSHVLSVTYCPKDKPVKSFHDVPNLRLREEGGRRSHYFLIKPAVMQEWTGYDDTIRNIYRVIGPYMVKRLIDSKGLNIPSYVSQVAETLHFVSPVFWFEYNFVTKRFSMRFPSGIIVRRIKESQYGVFYKTPKVKVDVEGNEVYALVMSSNRDIDAGYWLHRKDFTFCTELQELMMKHMGSVGWNAHVTVTTTPEMLQGHVDAFDQNIKAPVALR
ncbi:hypothetical protein D3C87_1014670 [compost metagenome]